MTRSIIAAEIDYLDASTSPVTTGTLYLASEGFVTDNTDTLSNTFFSGRIDGNVSYSLKLSTAFWGGDSTIGIGAIEVINDDGALDGWLNYDFRDQAIVLRQHTTGASYNSSTVALNAIIEKMSVTGEKRLRFVIRDPASALVVPINTATYTTGDAIGALIPIAFGQPELCAPVMVDEAYLEYHINDVAVESITAVYDQGVSVDYTPVTGGFRLVANPSGLITASFITAGSGIDPILTLSDGEYLVTGSGRSIQMISAGTESPDISLAKGFSDIPESKVSTSGGKWYFEAYVDQMDAPGQPAGNSGDVSVGISSTAIVNPQDPKSAEFYCLTMSQHASSGASVLTLEANINNVLVDTGNESKGGSDTSSWDDNTIGVLVDFDALTISYLFANTDYWAASPTTNTTMGPHTLAAGTYFPVLGTVRAFTSNENIITIRLIEDDFTYAIPSGYSAWSVGIIPDASFAGLTTSISDRVSVTFDSTSVNAISALSHSSPAVEYTHSYYLDSSQTAGRLLGWAMSGLGGYWFVNRLGAIQVGQLVAPGTSVRTIDDTHIISDIQISPDYAKALSNRAGALRNWSPYRDSEVAGSATEVWKQQITRDYQSEYQSTNTLASGYAHADGAEMNMSLLSDATAASTEADRLTALYVNERSFYKVPIAMTAVTFSAAIDEIGSTYTVKSDRFGLDGGVGLLLVGVDGSFLKNELTLTFWGDVSLTYSTMQVELGSTLSFEVELSTTVDMDAVI